MSRWVFTNHSAFELGEMSTEAFRKDVLKDFDTAQVERILDIAWTCFVHWELIYKIKVLSITLTD